ncbi:hypothetical protein [Pseudomonas sichuanensis]|uniref:hypothetical protein n=1 Tax=Pseudomonas sichuanensis TaxID=2213015 RepID=UPI00215E3EDD|nr:hypothetical protein [Pseudomonas sichuanensis]UVL88881.1 hypothetical protein LOY51_24515 [Pseudomonas sichuanensis]
MPDEKFAHNMRPAGYFVVSPKKLALMSFFSLGLYWWFCFHRHWVHQRCATGDRIWPLARAFFLIFYLYPLIRRLDRDLVRAGLGRRWSPAALFLLYLAVMICQIGSGLMVDAIDPLWFLPFAIGAYALLIWVEVKLQQAANLLAGDPQGAQNSRMSWANWIWMTPGLLLWGVVVLSITVSLSLTLLLAVISWFQ